MESNLGSLHLIIGSLTFGSPEWVWIAVAIGAVGLGVLLFSYARTSRPVPLRIGLGLLKLLALMLVAVCLLNPMWSSSRAKPGENVVVLLTDGSASMQIQHGNSSRGEQYSLLLNEASNSWSSKLAEDFDVRHFSYSSRLSAREPGEVLDFDGTASNLGGALKGLRQRFQGQPLAGIVYLGDGNATDIIESEWLKGVPVYPVKLRELGDDLKDIAIRSLSVSQTSFEDAPVTVVAELTSEGFTSGSLLVSLSDTDAKADAVPQQQTIAITPGEPMTVRFLLRPDRVGLLFYQLNVEFLHGDSGVQESSVPIDDGNAETLSETDAIAENHIEGTTGNAVETQNPEAEERDQSQEVTLANNHRLIVVDRGKQEHRILYVGGRPNWEHKFLNRALSEDEQLQLVSMIRIARKEARFDFRGRAGESSNSLFRGLEEEPDEETEAYDQPVLVRLNTRDEKELSDGFPKTREQLYEYEAVILDDVEAKFFTHDQQVMLDRYVSERGGSLLMLGGRDSFRHGDWHKSPLKDALPVYLDRAVPSQKQSVRWDFTREGWLEPWLRIRDQEAAEEERVSNMPAFQIVSSIREIKPGARVLAQFKDESGAESPALVTQKYGQGQAAAMLLGDYWRWSMQRGDITNDDAGTAWRQFMRWMVSDVPTRVDAKIEWTRLGTTPAVAIQVDVRDKDYLPQDNAAVSVRIEQPDGTSLTLNAEPSLDEAGLFECEYVPRLAGAYEASVRVNNEQGLATGENVIGWTSDPAADEFRETNINHELLARLASDSGGEVLSEQGLIQFVDDLPTQEMPVMKTETQPLWHSPWLLILALALLATEWGLRRWKGLP